MLMEFLYIGNISMGGIYLMKMTKLGRRPSYRNIIRLWTQILGGRVFSLYDTPWGAAYGVPTGWARI